MGRGLFSLLMSHLPDIDTRTVREAEFVCNSPVGFNFGDSHFHDEDLIRTVQREAGSSPGSSGSRRAFGSASSDRPSGPPCKCRPITPITWAATL